jgi:hypothetical protein
MSRRGASARRTAQVDAGNDGLYAVTLRDYMQRRLQHAIEPHDAVVAEVVVPELPPETPVLLEPEVSELSREIHRARDTVNRAYVNIVPSLKSALPSTAPRPMARPPTTPRRRQAASAGRFHTPVACPPIAAAAPTELDALQRVAAEGFKDFRSAVRCAETVVEEFDVLTRGACSAPHITAIWGVLDSLLLASTVPPELWARMRARLSSVIFDDEGRLYRDAYTAEAAEHALVLRQLQRREKLLPHLEKFCATAQRVRTQKLARMVLRGWRDVAKQALHRRRQSDMITLRQLCKLRLSLSFLRWRRLVATTKRRGCAAEAIEARSEARHAKVGLQQAVSRGKEETLRELKRMQAKYEDEKALREAQFATLSAEIHSLSAEITAANVAFHQATAERDLWRVCWNPIHASVKRRCVTKPSGVLTADSKRLRELIQRLQSTDRARTQQLLAERTATHRSVSSNDHHIAEDLVLVFAALQDNVQDLLLHWANDQLAEIGSTRSVLSATDLAEPELLRELIESVMRLLPPRARGDPNVSVCERLRQLLDATSLAPQLQCAMAFCPYASTHLFDDRLFKPTQPGWFYWVLFSLFSTRCSVWIIEELQSARDSITSSTDIVAGKRLATGAGVTPNASTVSPRRRVKKLSIKRRPADKQTENVKCDAATETAAGVNQALGVDGLLGSMSSTSDAAAEAKAYLADRDGRAQWNQLLSLVGTAVVEYNCLEFDRTVQAFRAALDPETEHPNATPTTLTSRMLGAQPGADTEQQSGALLTSILLNDAVMRQLGTM